MGCGSTVCSEACTGVDSRHALLVGMKVSFQEGWNSKVESLYSRDQITDDEVATLVSDLERMVPQQAHK